LFNNIILKLHKISQYSRHKMAPTRRAREIQIDP